MKIFNTSQSLVEHLANEIQPMGMVPTMGALHMGHLSLIERALRENRNVLISIFINPTQFEDKADLENYPVSLDSDLQKIKQYNGNILVYVPKAGDIYGNAVSTKSFDLGGLDEVMEGEKRKGHFQGGGHCSVSFPVNLPSRQGLFWRKGFSTITYHKSYDPIIGLEN